MYEYVANLKKKQRKDENKRFITRKAEENKRKLFQENPMRTGENKRKLF